MSQQALLIEGAQNCGSKVRDLHMEQLGHLGCRGGGRWSFRYSLQTPLLREASVRQKKKKKHGEDVGEEKYSDKEGVNRKCVKDEKTCQREVERREGKIERILKEAESKNENRVEMK